MSDFPKRLVLVDDDKDIRRVVRAVVEAAYPDIMLVTCAAGEELIRRLRELQPDLILLDARMPEMSGPDVLHKLREREEGKHIPVILMTSLTKLVMVDKYKELGVIGVIHKPFEVVKLNEAISELWVQFLESKLGL